MKTLYLLISLFIFRFSLLNCTAQNLVPNPSFEDYTICPTNYYMLPTDWYTCSGDPDYFNACDTTNSFGVPTNGFGYQQADDGKAYCGFYAWSFTTPPPYYKEYLGCQLISPLTIGVKYYITFKVSRVSSFNCATNNIGLLFSTISFQVYDPYSATIFGIPTNNFSHIVDTNIIINSQNWTTIKGSIVADSAYQYLLIGNFFDIAHTDTILTYYNYNFDKAYYYLDEVCVSTDSLTCNSTVAISEINVVNDFINIFPNPASENITINLPQSYENSDIIIYNILGEKIKDYIIQPMVNKIDIRNLYPGVYFIQIIYNNKTIIKKIVTTKN